MNAVAFSLAFILMMDTDLEAELAAYPPRAVVDAQIDFAAECFRIFYEGATHSYQGSNSRLWFSNQVRYINWSRCLWARLSIAQNRGASRLEREEALLELKDALATMQGAMPPIVCYWTFLDGPPPPRLGAPR
jgi:hypothetical protein